MFKKLKKKLGDPIPWKLKGKAKSQKSEQKKRCEYDEVKARLDDIQSRFQPQAVAYFMGRLVENDDIPENIRRVVSEKYGEVLGTPYIKWSQEFSESSPYFDRLGEYIECYLNEKEFKSDQEMISRDKFRRWLLDEGEAGARKELAEMVSHRHK